METYTRLHVFCSEFGALSNNPGFVRVASLEKNLLSNEPVNEIWVRIYCCFQHITVSMRIVVYGNYIRIHSKGFAEWKKKKEKQMHQAVMYLGLSLYFRVGAYPNDKLYSVQCAVYSLGLCSISVTYTLYRASDFPLHKKANSVFHFPNSAKFRDINKNKIYEEEKKGKKSILK